MNEVNFGGVTPNLAYADANAALEWLTRVLGFRERARYVDKDGVVRQAEVFVGDSEVWLSGHAGQDKDVRPQGSARWLTVWVDDVNAVHGRVRAAGVEAKPPTDQTWGVRNFSVEDPGGYHWSFARRLASGYQQVRSPEEGGLLEIMAASE